MIKAVAIFDGYKMWLENQPRTAAPALKPVTGFVPRVGVPYSVVVGEFAGGLYVAPVDAATDEAKYPKKAAEALVLYDSFLEFEARLIRKAEQSKSTICDTNLP